jgi:ATP-dependent RNA circularization protein (DNA/RNA ligase family)
MLEYPNLLRLKFDTIQQIRSDKRYADVKMEKDFFKSTELIVEEKLDGSQSALGWKHGKPYAQGRSGHISEFDKRVAFDGFWSWIWQNCDKIEKTKGHLVYGEWMKPQHSIVYDKLPDFFMAFDVYDLKAKRFLDLNKKKEFLTMCGLERTFVIHVGPLNKEDVPKLVDNVPSMYSSTQNCEGCVIKDYKRQLFLKYVSREFLEELFDDSGHWTSRQKVKYNRLVTWE